MGAPVRRVDVCATVLPRIAATIQVGAKLNSPRQPLEAWAHVLEGDNAAGRAEHLGGGLHRFEAPGHHCRMFGKRGKASRSAQTSRLLFVTAEGVRQMPTNLYGMDLVPEVARLLGSPNIRSTRLGEDLTLWHAEESPGNPRSGRPNPLASRLAAEHGEPPVTGPAVISGPLLYGSPYPLAADEADRITAGLSG